MHKKEIECYKTEDFSPPVFTFQSPEFKKLLLKLLTIGLDGQNGSNIYPEEVMIFSVML
jgi:hypothetical protein